VQYALKDDVLYVLEANPRASRTVPFVSKATAIPLAKACARIMLGTTISQLREEGMLVASGDGASVAPHAPIAVKEAVLPFHRFRRADGEAIDSLLGPEMKSTGEVMGIDRDFGTAFAKSQTAAYGSLPASGTVFVSVANRDKRSLVFPVKRLADLSISLPPRAPRRCCAATEFPATRCASISSRRNRAGPRCPRSTRSKRVWSTW
jgi:carbamoyl-phosphate synthase large subunit